MYNTFTTQIYHKASHRTIWHLCQQAQPCCATFILPYFLLDPHSTGSWSSVTVLNTNNTTTSSADVKDIIRNIIHSTCGAYTMLSAPHSRISTRILNNCTGGEDTHRCTGKHSTTLCAYTIQWSACALRLLFHVRPRLFSTAPTIAMPSITNIETRMGHSYMEIYVDNITQ